MKGKREKNKSIDLLRKDDITIDEVKACSIFSHFSDDQAMVVIDTIKQLVSTAFDLQHRRNRSLNFEENDVS